jgi:predicted nucleotidyltransferase component of viral defense system
MNSEYNSIEYEDKMNHALEAVWQLQQKNLLGSDLLFKGGTAINGVVLDRPRLSVDIDFNYVGTSSRKESLIYLPSVIEEEFPLAGYLVSKRTKS